jgi:hypothetical protein
MKERERQIQNQQGAGPGSHGGGGDEPEGQGLEEARRARSAADKRIEKLLSGNSADYVAHSAQHGGQ